ncbi:MAG: hypothetical protein FJ361_07515 [Gemmatimonadetes bacterium]|nr:hypothetical protein [Gemmatimonadota bacterium]
MNTLALRLAAGDGRIDGVPVGALVSAGFTLLQRCAPLVIALGTRRAGILLPPGIATVAALAACDGRGAVWFDVDGRVTGGGDGGALRGAATVTAERITTLGVAAIFTTTTLADQVAAGTPMVLFDEVPTRAIFVASDGRRIDIDLGSHFGLTIEGSTDEPGREEECLVIADTDVSLSHHEVLSGDDRIPADLTALLAPLLRGAHLQTVITP